MAWTLVAVGIALLAPGSASAICNDPCGGGGGGTTVTTLQVTVSGSGVVKDGTTTVCSSGTCNIHYLDTETASLTATGSNGQSFIGFSGDCSGTGTCSLDMSTGHAVAATFADITPPAAPTISSPTSGQVIQSLSTASANVTFSGDSSTTSFLCQLDLGAQTACSPGWNTGGLTTGSHIVYVWAKDAAGNVSTASSRTFKAVNLSDTTLAGTPAASAVTSDNTTAFTYSSSVNGATYDCTLDGSEMVSCNGDLVGLADGVHTFTVAAGVTPDGATTYWDQSPATRTWTVDTHAPSVSITSAPSAGANSTEQSANIQFTAADPSPGTALTLACSLDDAAFSACPSATGASYSGLAAGPHRFRVQATDAAGNKSAIAERDWTVIVDGDGDGFFTNTDCNDSSAAIHPGATDMPGDGIDQDCSGADAPATSGPGAGSGSGAGDPTGSQAAPTVAAKLARSFKVSKKGVLVKTLKLTGVTAGAAVTLTCKGKGCAFKAKKVVPKNGAASLQALFKKKPLRPGAVIRITLTRPAMNGLVFTLTVKKRGAPVLNTASI